jgi:hypothetical protein
VLEENKAERHIRGGLATRKKYMEMKNNWFLIYIVILLKYQLVKRNFKWNLVL